MGDGDRPGCFEKSESNSGALAKRRVRFRRDWSRGKTVSVCSPQSLLSLLEECIGRGASSKQADVGGGIAKEFLSSHPMAVISIKALSYLGIVFGAGTLGTGCVLRQRRVDLDTRGRKRRMHGRPSLSLWERVRVGQSRSQVGDESGTGRRTVGHSHQRVETAFVSPVRARGGRPSECPTSEERAS